MSPRSRPPSSRGTDPGRSPQAAAPRRRTVAATATVRPMVPDVAPLTRALDGAAPLASLLQRLQASQACLDAVKLALPDGLATQVKAGPLDEDGWTLLAANAAVSAKLRQLQPRLHEALAARGLKVNAIRVKVHNPRLR